MRSPRHRMSELDAQRRRVVVAVVGLVTCANALGATVQNDVATTNIDVPVGIAVLSNDDGVWSSASFTQAANGTVAAGSGGLVYTPAIGFEGIDSFSYSVAEEGGPELSATVTVTVTGTVAAIVVANDIAGTDVNTPVTILLVDNDTGNWVAGNFTQPANGVVVGGGSGVNYQPNNGYLGVDVFDYSLTDVVGASDSATVSISVNPIDPKEPTLPLFRCEEGQVFCNREAVSGLETTSGYGRGAAVIDVNGDGWLDIFYADSDDRHAIDFGQSTFFLNQGDGTFAPDSLGLAEADTFATWTGSFGDFDNDGDPDLIIANGGYSGSSSLEFYENQVNESGTYLRRTDQYGIGIVNSFLSHWWGASWADYDNDGWLDVIVTRTEGPPVLFRNNAGIGFSDVTDAVGIDTFFFDREDGKNPVWIDADNDGDLDLYLAGFARHAFWRNDGVNGFVDITAEIFPDPLPNVGTTPAASPSVFAALAEDFDQDGFDDLYLGRWTEQDLVLINDGMGGFRQFGQELGIDALHTTRTELAQPYENTMGLGTGDLQGDGYPDIIIGTGDPERADKDIVFCNDGAAFARCTELLFGGAVTDYRTRGHAPVVADFDNNGTLDVFMNMGGHPEWDAVNVRDTREHSALLINRGDALPNSAVITLQGTVSNRDSVGAKLRIEFDGNTRFYGVRPMQGFQAQNSASIVTSFGTSESATLTAFWPSGRSISVTVAPGERRLLVEP